MGLHPAGFLVGASIVALLASPAAAQAAVVDVTPATPVVGAPLTLTGRGLPPRAVGRAHLGPADGTRFRTDRRGRMSVVLRVPASVRPGKRTLVVRAGRRRFRTPLFVVTAPRAPSTLTLLSGGRRFLLRPAEGTPGARLSLRGSGLRARERIEVRLAKQPLWQGAASSRGRLSIASSVPRVAPGAYGLTVRSKRVRVRLRFRVGAAAAPPPAAGVPASASALSAPTPVPASTVPPPPAITGPAPVIAAAGDIACDPLDRNFNAGAGLTGLCQQRATSNVLIAARPDVVLGLGDMQYNVGGLSAFQAVYGPTWGRVNPRIYPVPGNHEYGTPGAAGFFSYFGDRAGTSGLGYFSFDLGAWHIIALNSNCAAVPCGPGSAQHNWLQADLAAHRNACTLAFFHHPLFGSGQGVNEQPIRPFWDTLYAAGADLVLNGHSHNYERFAPQSPAGAAEPARGIRQITVGTGGDDLQPFLPGVAANSQSRSSTSFGVLTLTLQPSGYSWRFRPAAGGTFTDSGTGSCH